MQPMSVGIMLGVGDDPDTSLEKVKTIGVDNVQMGCPPDRYFVPDPQEKLKQSIAVSGITITTVFCGFAGESYADIPTVKRTVGYVPADYRTERLAKTKRISDFAKNLGVGQIAAHAGFIPECPTDPLYTEMVKAIQEISDYVKRNGQIFSLETGQETAPSLLRFLKDVNRGNVKVNFDPANMILYGSGEPIEALELLKDFIVSVHCKDGKWPTEEHKLGVETPLGEGDVGMDRFIDKLKEIGYAGPLTIEREISGDQQIQDLIKAKELLENLRDGD